MLKRAERNFPLTSLTYMIQRVTRHSWQKITWNPLLKHMSSPLWGLLLLRMRKRCKSKMTQALLSKLKLLHDYNIHFFLFFILHFLIVYWINSFLKLLGLTFYFINFINLLFCVKIKKIVIFVDFGIKISKKSVVINGLSKEIF